MMNHEPQTFILVLLCTLNLVLSVQKKCANFKLILMALGSHNLSHGDM